MAKILEHLYCPHASLGVVCPQCGPDDIANTLRQAKTLYYTGTPGLTDTVFDWLEERLRGVAPQHPYFEEVGHNG